MTTPDHIKRIIERIDPADREVLEQYMDEQAWSPQKAWAPERCPLTGLHLFMWIEHPTDGMVPTYGGPFDSYTIPVRDEDGSYCRERYDHDEGGWLIEEREDVGIQVIDDQLWVSDGEDPAELAGKVNSLSQEVEKLRQERDALISQLRPIGGRLITQDGRMTADPLFCVFEKREVVANEEFDYDYISWTDAESDYQEVEGEKRERLEALYKGYRHIPERYQRCAIKEFDSFVTACFTEQGCKDFLAIQGHNLRKPFTYVTSLFRNEEMKTLRAMMMGLAIPAKLPTNPVNWNNEARRMASIMYPHMKKEFIND